MRIKTLTIVLALTLTAAAQTQSTTPGPKSSKKSAADWQAVHNSAIVIDTHADTPGRFVDEGFDPSQDAGSGHWDLKKVKAGNLGAEFFSIWVDPDKFKGQYAHRALDMIDSVYQTVAKHPDDMVMAYSAKDIRAARRGPHKRVAILMGVEGGHAIENDMSLLRDYYRLGVRYMTLTWATSNEWAKSSGDVKVDPQTGKKDDPGLTEYGRQIVREMNRLGMMVDISHVSDRSYYNALTASIAPVIASHSSARALTNNPRNMDDDMLVALARNNGVVMVNFNCGFLSDDYERESQKYFKDHPELMQKYRELESQYGKAKSEEIRKQMDAMKAEMNKAVPRPPMTLLVDHIDHIAKVAGIDHVGLGSDFDGVPCLPEGIDSAADLPKITKELMARGYTDEQMQKILGGNLLRVFTAVEKVAYEMQHATNPDTRKEVPVPSPTK